MKNISNIIAVSRYEHSVSISDGLVAKEELASLLCLSISPTGIA